jgi:hypothetical protein
MLVSGQAGPLQGPVAVGQAIAAASRDPPGPRRQPAPCTASPAAATHRDRQHNTEGGLDNVDPDADERGAADGRAPAVFARAAAIASQADEAVEVVDAALDHSSHRDRAGGRRITVSTSAMDLVQELQKTVDELAGAPRRPSRSDRGKHHAVVTPLVEASPDRSDFAKLGETIAASLVQAAQEHANHAGVLLERTKQFADDIRSQVADKSRELAELNERGGSIGTTLARSTSVLGGSALNISTSSDLAGTYADVGGGAAVAADVSGVRLRNEKGVVLELRGAKLGVEVSANLAIINHYDEMMPEPGRT